MNCRGIPGFVFRDISLYNLIYNCLYIYIYIYIYISRTWVYCGGFLWINSHCIIWCFYILWYSCVTTGLCVCVCVCVFFRTSKSMTHEHLMILHVHKLWDVRFEEQKHLRDAVCSPKARNIHRNVQILKSEDIGSFSDSYPTIWTISCRKFNRKSARIWLEGRGPGRVDLVCHVGFHGGFSLLDVESDCPTVRPWARVLGPWGPYGPVQTHKTIVKHIVTYPGDNAIYFW